MPPPGVPTVENIMEGFKDVFDEQIMKFFQSEQPEQLQQFSEILLRSTAAGIRSGDEEIIASVKRTARGMVELARVIAVNAAWDIIDAALDYLIKIGKAALQAVLKAYIPIPTP